LVSQYRIGIDTDHSVSPMQIICGIIPVVHPNIKDEIRSDGSHLTVSSAGAEANASAKRKYPSVFLVAAPAAGAYDEVPMAQVKFSVAQSLTNDSRVFDDYRAIG
jgi:hypothetical protein